MKKNYLFFVFLAIVLTFNLKAQDLSLILEKSERQTNNYRETFKNLVGNEKGIFETYKKDGNIANKKVIESNLIIYQSANDANIVTEYRYIKKINGKDINQNETKTAEFFTDLLKSASAQEELQKINSRSLRFDKSLTTGNLTLIQAPILAEHIRPYFQFKIIGKEKIDDNEVYLIEYQQLTNCPYILVNAQTFDDSKLTMEFGLLLPNSIREINERLQGRIWIDSETFQIWREERELTIKPDDSPNSIKVFSTIFEFAKGNHEILEPKKISLSSYLIKKNGNEYKSIKDSQLNFEYSNFVGEKVFVKASGIGESIIVEKN